MEQTWDEYFIEVAKVVATKSRDPHTKVGCVIVDSNNRIISTGYNGAPKNFPRGREDWTRPAKYNFVVHSESNAILYAKTDLTDCTLYCTHEPCLQCAKLICGSGIKRVVFLNYKDDEDAFQLFKMCEVKLQKLIVE